MHVFIRSFKRSLLLMMYLLLLCLFIESPLLLIMQVVADSPGCTGRLLCMVISIRARLSKGGIRLPHAGGPHRRRLLRHGHCSHILCGLLGQVHLPAC